MVSAFLQAAFPWVCMGLALALACAFLSQRRS